MQRFKAVLAAVLVMAMVMPLQAIAAPTSSTFSIVFTDADNGFMSGSRTDALGFVARTTDGGMTWSAQSQSGPRMKVHSLGGGAAWAVSPYSGSPLSTADWGVSWSPASPLVPEGGGTYEPWDVKQTGPTTAISAGMWDHPVHGELAAVWRTTDNGSTWEVVDAGPIYPYDTETNTWPQSIARHEAISSDASGQAIYAAGTEYQLVRYGSDEDPQYQVEYKQALLKRSTDGGSTWTTQTIDTEAKPAEDIAVANADDAWLVAESMVYRTGDGGSTWTKITSGAYQYLRVDGLRVDSNAVAATSDQHAIIAGSDIGTTPRGMVVRTIDGGATWKSYRDVDGVGLRLQDVFILSPTRAVAVGDNNVMLFLQLNPDGTMVLENRITATNGDFSIDVTPPTVSPSMSYASKQTTLTLEAVDDSQVSTLSYRIDGGTWQNRPGAASTVVFSSATPRAYHVEYKATDNKGNTSAVSSVDVRVKLGTSLAFSAPSTSSYASARVYGYLKDADGKPLSGRAIAIKQTAPGAVKTLGTVTTSSSGYFSYGAKPSVRASYQASFAGDSSYLARTSYARTVTPRVYLTAPSIGTNTASFAKTYTASGYLKPRHTAGTRPVRLYAYRYESGKWVLRRTAYGTVSDYSTYSRYKASMRLPYKGSWRMRAYHAADSSNAATYSSYRYITVK